MISTTPSAPAPTQDIMAATLHKRGPLSVAKNAMSMQFYKGGIAQSWFFHAPFYCMTTYINHGVAVVGFGEERGTKYWTIKNSWSKNWGEEGYYRIVRGRGACGARCRSVRGHKFGLVGRSAACPMRTK